MAFYIGCIFIEPLEGYNKTMIPFVCISLYKA